MYMVNPFDKVFGEQDTPVQHGADVSAVMRAKGGKGVPAAPTAPAGSTLQQQVAAAGAQEARRGATIADKLAGRGVQAGAEAASRDVEAARESLRGRGKMFMQEQESGEVLAGMQVAGAEDVADMQRQDRHSKVVRELNNTSFNKLADISSELGTNLDNIFREFQASEQELAIRKDGATLERIGFNLALQDKVYLNELSKIYETRDMRNQLKWNEEQARIMYGESTAELLRNLGFKTSEGAKSREFNEKLASIKGSDALDLARALIKDNSTRMQWEAVGTGVSGYLDYRTKQDKLKPKG